MGPRPIAKKDFIENEGRAQTYTLMGRKPCIQRTFPKEKPRVQRQGSSKKKNGKKRVGNELEKKGVIGNLAVSRRGSACRTSYQGVYLKKRKMGR